jgi:hypothetical protein
MKFGENIFLGKRSQAVVRSCCAYH